MQRDDMLSLYVSVYPRFRQILKANTDIDRISYEHSPTDLCWK